MKTTSTNSFDFENQTVTGLNMNADQGFNDLDNAHGELVGVSQPLVVGATDGADVNLLHILGELETQASQAPAVVEDAAPAAELGLILIEPSAGCRIAFPHKGIAPVAQEDSVQTEDTASSDEAVVDMKIAPEGHEHTIFIDPPVPFTGWLGDDAPHIEVDPALVDVAVDVDVDVDVDAEVSAELPETVELVGEPVFIDPNDLPICIALPIVVADPIVWIDDGAFVFQFPEVFVAQPSVDGTDGNSTDVSVDAPQVQVCEGYPAPIFVELNGEPDTDTVEITLTGVAESHLA